MMLHNYIYKLLPKVVEGIIHIGYDQLFLIGKLLS